MSFTTYGVEWLRCVLYVVDYGGFMTKDVKTGRENVASFFVCGTNSTHFSRSNEALKQNQFVKYLPLILLPII